MQAFRRCFPRNFLEIPFEHLQYCLIVSHLVLRGPVFSQVELGAWTRLSAGPLHSPLPGPVKIRSTPDDPIRPSTASTSPPLANWVKVGAPPNHVLWNVSIFELPLNSRHDFHILPVALTTFDL